MMQEMRDVQTRENTAYLGAMPGSTTIKPTHWAFADPGPFGFNRAQSAVYFDKFVNNISPRRAALAA